MEKKTEIVISKIAEYVDRIEIYCKEIKTAQELEENTMCLEAVCFDIIQIGELAKLGLTDELKSGIKSIPWNQINGLRNRIVHGYGEINKSIIWEVIQEDLPKLKEELRRIK